MLELLIFFLFAIFSDTIAAVLHVSVQNMDMVTLVFGLVLLVHLFFLSAPYVPTGRKEIAIMMDLAKIAKGDTVYDIGSGDGRILRAASEFSARRLVGFEISWMLVVVSVIWNHWSGKKHVETYARDFWKHDFSDADVIFCFLLPGPMERIEREIWPKLKPGTRLISRAFSMKGTKKHTDMNGVFLYVKD